MSDVSYSPIFVQLAGELASRSCYKSNLKGRLLTFIDATFQDPIQREASKSFIRNIVREHYQETNQEIDMVLNYFTEVMEGEKIEYTPIQTGRYSYDCKNSTNGLRPQLEFNK